ncbi:MAG: O-antigen ligase family protein [Pseudonocardia sp.]|nr:O-antigen ligase family protein [Pseudonocardia sp.]
MTGRGNVSVRERPAATAPALPPPGSDPGRRPDGGRVRSVLTAGGGVVIGTALAPLAAAGAAASAAVRRPGGLVAVMLLLICTPVQFDVGGSVFGLGDVASVGLVLVAAAVLWRSGRRLDRRCALLFGGLAAAGALATLAAADPFGSAVGWVRYLQLFVLVPVAVAVAVRERRDLLLVVNSLIMAAVVEGAVGVWQFLSGTGAYYGGEPIRAVGTFGATDVIAMSVVVGLGLVLAAGLALARTGPARVGYLVVAVALMVPLGLSLSRGSWISTGIALLVVLLAAGRRTFFTVAAAATAVLIVVVGGLGVGSEVLTERLDSITSSVASPDSSVTDRYDLWSTAVAIWSDHPVTGVGIKAFPQYRDGHAPLGLSSASDIDQAGSGFEHQELLSPHNQYLLVLSEQGIVGAGVFTLLMLVLVGGSLLALRRSEPWLRGIGLGVLGLSVWQVLQFVYGDVGGASSLITSVTLGLAAWWAFESPRRPVPAGRAAPVTPAAVRTTLARPPRVAAGTARALPVLSPTARVGVARAAAVSAVLAAVGSMFGLVRDLLVAAFFGATTETDAFLVAWTVPETLAPLLIEGAMAFVLVPAFGRALVAQEEGREVSRITGVPVVTDPVRELMEGTAPVILAALGAFGLAVGVAAPWLVDALAPGLADPQLAALCMRIVAVTIPLLGIAGYLAAALRTHHRFAAPAAIYLAYNVGIIATILLSHDTIGVVGAAVGISVGAGLMVLVQAPSAMRALPRPRTYSLRRRTDLFVFAALVPVAAYTVARQAQTFVERFAGAGLPEGTISHLNYAQKVSQIPITLSFMAAAVTFPMFARSVAAGRSDEARRRMEIDLVVVGAVALVVAAYLWVFAPSVVATLFERGAFTPDDTADTASIMRVYVLGLLGQAVVSLLVRPYFTFEGRLWFPGASMAVGLIVTGAATFLFVGGLGAVGIAAANALGITVTAVMLAAGSGRRLSVAPGRVAYARLAAVAVPVLAGTGAGLAVRGLLEGLPAPVEAALGGAVVVLTAAGVGALGWWGLASRGRARGRGVGPS